MIKALEQAVEKIRKLPADRQAYAATVLEEIAAAGANVYRLSDEERALVDVGLADLDAGQIVPDGEMDAFWKRHDA
jgi:predicted transcriptional regulator